MRLAVEIGLSSVVFLGGRRIRQDRGRTQHLGGLVSEVLAEYDGFVTRQAGQRVSWWQEHRQSLGDRGQQ